MAASIETRMDELIDGVYAAGLEPERWDDVMSSMRRVFRTAAETFYFLDFRPRSVRPVHLAGIDDRWLQRFDELYFTPDNPWVVHTRTLHRPGVVRTNERLAAYTRDPQILYRSVYYNEWMRPQGFRFTIGNTLLSGEGTVANVTLLRCEDQPSFSPAEVRAFERLSVHLTRALNVGLRLERASQQREQGSAVFDRLEHGVLTLDAQGRLLYANAAAEALLRRRIGLTLRDGFLRTVNPDEAQSLETLLRNLTSGVDGSGCGRPAAITLRCGRGSRRLDVNGMPLSSGRARYLASRPAVLLTIVDRSGPDPGLEPLLRRAYGMTPAEARLGVALAQGASLRDTADRLGVTYATARGTLKVLFRKTETHRQGQLVARIHADLARQR